MSLATKTTKKFKRPEQHYDMVEVVWDDAAGFKDGWKDKPDPIEPQLALSVGFLIVDDPGHIVLASDTDERGAHNGRTQIPRGMVRRIRVLRKKDAQKVELGVSRNGGVRLVVGESHKQHSEPQLSSGGLVEYNLCPTERPSGDISS